MKTDMDYIAEQCEAIDRMEGREPLPPVRVEADVRQFVCILDNCESFVTWQESREDAIRDCTAKAGKPQHVWATGRKLPNAPAEARRDSDVALQPDVGGSESKGE